MIQNLRKTFVTFQSITLAWDELSCLDRNGVLTGYRIEYGTTTSEVVAGTTFTATGLASDTNYTFQVAGLNSDGRGILTTIIPRTLPSGNR